jgi:beta-galactosidase
MLQLCSRAWLLLSVLIALPPAFGQRVVVALDGEWQIEDSLSGDQFPQSWTHTAPVPGLAHSSHPAFPDVDQFDSKEVISNRIRQKKLPDSAAVDTPGTPRQNRNYFWYRKVFQAPARRQLAILKINKAQFGTAVWMNGRKIGEHRGCFTAGYFDVTDAIQWSASNTLLVRIGAHPAVLPVTFPAGSDFEKNRWTPGIYDDVTLFASGNPAIESVQVAPQIQGSRIQVQAKLRNTSRVPVAFEIKFRISPGQLVRARRMRLAPGEQTTVTETIPIPNAELWTPEHPFLYRLETSTGGDTLATRFGMREFRFDTATRRAWLNGKVYFMRGSNITLHRFFEDPLSGQLPWDEAWVRRLLIDIPKRMNWNSFRFCIGPVPDKWLDIADEAGLLIQNEYAIWTGRSTWGGNYSREWDSDELVRQYGEWMRDNWNHPSVVIWDANNESWDPVFGQKVIPAVRPLDLSARPWENSYNPPVGPDDPVEDHPYLFSRIRSGDHKPFDLRELENMSGNGKPTATPTGHAEILNEYGWLWLLRDGSPTELTGNVYEHLAGPKATGADRLAMYGYALGGLTEFWRAHRNHAGVLHFVYLTACCPGAYTCDNFQDVVNLKLEPNFESYVREAFKPLGVYLNFWQPTLKVGERRQMVVMMVNDENVPASGTLALTLQRPDGKSLAKCERPFQVAGLGQQTFNVDLAVPDAEGVAVLIASALKKDAAEPTLSRRKLRITRK